MTDCIIIDIYSIGIFAVAVKTPYIPTYTIFFGQIHGRADGSHILEWGPEGGFAFQEAGLKLDVTRWVPRFTQSVYKLSCVMPKEGSVFFPIRFLPQNNLCCFFFCLLHVLCKTYVIPLVWEELFFSKLFSV